MGTTGYKPGDSVVEQRGETPVLATHARNASLRATFLRPSLARLAATPFKNDVNNYGLGAMPAFAFLRGEIRASLSASEDDEAVEDAELSASSSFSFGVRGLTRTSPLSPRKHTVHVPSISSGGGSTSPHTSKT